MHMQPLQLDIIQRHHACVLQSFRATEMICKISLHVTEFQKISKEALCVPCDKVPAHTAQEVTRGICAPEVGSSSRIMEGLISSSCPTDTRLRSPPDIPLWKKPPAMPPSILSQRLGVKK